MVRDKGSCRSLIRKGTPALEMLATLQSNNNDINKQMALYIGDHAIRYGATVPRCQWILLAQARTEDSAF